MLSAYRMRRAEQRMNNRIQMLGTNGWQAHHSHPVVLHHIRSEIRTTVDRDFVAHLSQLASHFFVVALDPTVFRDHTPATNEGDFGFPFRWGCGDGFPGKVFI